MQSAVEVKSWEGDSLRVRVYSMAIWSEGPVHFSDEGAPVADTRINHKGDRIGVLGDEDLVALVELWSGLAIDKNTGALGIFGVDLAGGEADRRVVWDNDRAEAEGVGGDGGDDVGVDTRCDDWSASGNIVSGGAQRGRDHNPVSGDGWSRVVVDADVDLDDSVWRARSDDKLVECGHRRLL